MTVTYNLRIRTSHPWTFFQLLFGWRGSIWKAVYRELAVFLILYGILTVIYRLALSIESQGCVNQTLGTLYSSYIFEATVRYFDSRLDYIPLELILGFYCKEILSRWTKIYQNIGFIDNMGLMTSTYVRGKTEKARMYRRNIMRYCELVQVLVFRDISMRVRRRFPTIDTVVAAGFMLENEKEIYDSYKENQGAPKYWVPANWALDLTYKAWKAGHIESDYYKVTMQKEIRAWRTNIEWLFNYDWVPLPLMYPQVVCLVVHFYFMVALISRQHIIPDHELKGEIDMYFPFMTAIQFVFYMGWLKVVEAMLNPFGEDDDDFETNALIDRNITRGMSIVDECVMNHPKLCKDPFWEDAEVHPLYSEESSHIKQHIPKGSVSHVNLSAATSEIVMMPHEPSPSMPSRTDRPVSRRSVRVPQKSRTIPSVRSRGLARRIETLSQKIQSALVRLWTRLWNLLQPSSTKEKPAFNLSDSSLDNTKNSDSKVDQIKEQVSSPNPFLQRR